MRKLAAGASVLLLLAQAGSRQATSKPSISTASQPVESKRLKDLKLEAYRLYQAGKFHDAEAAYRESSRQALAESNPAAAIRELNNLASLRQSIFAYQGAMQTYLEAKHLAEQSGQREVLPIIHLNLMVLYQMMGNHQQAIQLGESTLPTLTGKLALYRANLLVNLGSSYSSAGQYPRSYACFRDAGEFADRAGDARLRAAALERSGYTLLEQGDVDQAEVYLLEAFRLRSLLAPVDLYLSYPKLGKLFAAQKKSRQARRFYDLALASQKSDPKGSPYYTILAGRAQASWQLGDSAAALSDFRDALDSIRRTRAEVLPIGSMQASWEGKIHETRSAFIRFTAEQAIRTHDQSLALESLVAAEESRLASIRSSDGVPKWQTKLPPEYWEKLGALQRAEALRESNSAKVTGLRLELTEIEGRAGLAAGWIMLPADPLTRARQLVHSFPDDEAAISFYLDEPNSYVWYLSRGQVQLARLPGKAAISAAVTAFRQAVADGSPGASGFGQKLYSQLFSELPSAVAQKTVWTLVADERLFELPFATLPVHNSGSETYLVERHALRQAPSFFLTSHEDRPTSQTFIGVGDAIYNAADSRLPASSNRPVMRAASFELPRLISSGDEIDRCARAWGGDSRVFKGREITAANLKGSLEQSPAVVHFATHFIRSVENRERAMMVLGLDVQSGEPQLMGSDQIAALHMSGGMVVMNGCHSGAGETIPGAGLMGLTRSWLIAGAQAVTGTYWPTADDTGELFVHLYRAYADRGDGVQSRGAAVALQRAQVAMIRSTGWRRSPRYWGAFFLVTRG